MRTYTRGAKKVPEEWSGLHRYNLSLQRCRPTYGAQNHSLLTCGILLRKCPNSYLWSVRGGSIVGPSFLVQLTLKKLIQKKIHVIGTLKVASMPQREMVDKPSSALNEIQLRTQRLQNKLDQVYCVWLSQGLLCLSWVTQKVLAVFEMSLKFISLQRRSFAHLVHHQSISRRPQSNLLDPRTCRVNLMNQH